MLRVTEYNESKRITIVSLNWLGIKAMGKLCSYDTAWEISRYFPGKLNSEQCLLMPMLKWDMCRFRVPYSGKIWQEKILANLAIMCGFTKILLTISLNTECVVDAVHQ